MLDLITRKETSELLICELCPIIQHYRFKYSKVGKDVAPNKFMGLSYRDEDNGFASIHFIK